MRISDVSADVCSSDLLGILRRVFEALHAIEGRLDQAVQDRDIMVTAHVGGPLSDETTKRLMLRKEPDYVHNRENGIGDVWGRLRNGACGNDWIQLGRATGRERVCNTV